MCKTCGCPTDGTEQLEITLEELTDQTAVKRLEQAIMGLSGVYHVHCHSRQGTALIDYNPRKMTRDELVKAVSNAGFTVMAAALPAQHSHGHGCVALIKRFFA